MNPDDLDDLLSPSPGPDENARREAVWHQSYRVLRRRKLARDVIRVGTYVLILTVGAGLGWSLKTTIPPSPSEPQLAHNETAPPPVPDRPPRSPRELELDAERTDDLRLSAELYREAGDRFLEQGNDVTSALRCYRQYLALLGEQRPEVAVSDSWLLISLKRARSQGELQ